jgi:hypothetical protein
MKRYQINEQIRSRLQKLAGINEIKIIKPQGTLTVAKLSLHPGQLDYEDFEELIIKEWIEGSGNLYILEFENVDDKLNFEIVPVDKGSGYDIGDLESGDLAGFFYESDFEQLIDNVLEIYGIKYERLGLWGDPLLRVSVEEMLEKGISFSYNGKILNSFEYKNIKEKI